LHAARVRRAACRWRSNTTERNFERPIQGALLLLLVSGGCSSGSSSSLVRGRHGPWPERGEEGRETERLPPPPPGGGGGGGGAGGGGGGGVGVVGGEKVRSPPPPPVGGERALCPRRRCFVLVPLCLSRARAVLICCARRGTVCCSCARAKLFGTGGKEFVGRERERQGRGFFCTKPSRALDRRQKKTLRKNNPKNSKSI
jgi:hypothetical protein